MAIETPLQRLRKAVKKAGGPGKVAAQIGTPASHLGNILGGTRAMGRETATRLRAVLPTVPAYVWADLLTLPLLLGLQRAAAMQDAAASVAPASDGTGYDHHFAHAPGARASTDSHDSARAGEPSSEASS